MIETNVEFVDKNCKFYKLKEENLKDVNEQELIAQSHD